MFSTPFSPHVGHGEYADVYDPAEDTFLLMDALEKDVKEIKQLCPRICLEVGAGSGVVSVFLASIIGPTSFYLCTDINPLAASCSVESARCNGVNIQPIITDLVTGLLPRLQNQVDVLIFNPPYVVTPSEEVVVALRHLGLVAKEVVKSWIGSFLRSPPSYQARDYFIWLQFEKITQRR
ncbi:methyltransferase N6AMT1 isoform X2 [Chiloscyllium plagiosum]|uniref:methyltransferase N6AMT1 isoform X2 n=1 Tax=Chiloscyllium plagiosum TaxID=36176 RepID=UPI001CB7E75D|nr:methyltransferase N6AMT1 isoform X2 [Chiloscyllium plagiosum]